MSNSLRTTNIIYIKKSLDFINFNFSYNLIKIFIKIFI